MPTLLASLLPRRKSLQFGGVALLGLAAAFLGLTCGGDSGTKSGPRIPEPRTFVTPQSVPTPIIENPISIENALPGITDWRVVTHAGQLLKAYSGEASIAKGERVTIHVSGEPGHTFTWKVLRIGWYGGAGARVLAQSEAPLAIEQYEIPAADPTTGLVECRWPEAFAVETGADWTSGIYLVLLEREDSKRTYAPFVLRDDERRGAAVLQIPVTTWQAYNNYGGEGLYKTSIGLSNGTAKEASFDRPYHEGDGAGQLFRYDEWFIRWAESMGFDLTYVANVDFDRNPSLLDGQKLFLSIGHDEYWTRPQREAVARALESGTNLAFFSANDAYWQIRLEPSRTGEPRAHRTQVCYKGRATIEDPLRGTNVVTTRWRDPAVGEPENALLGVMYTDYQYVDAPWVVTNASAWPYTGTGLSDGDAIPLIVGYEADRTFANELTPPGTVVLAHSPIITYRNASDIHEAATYDTPAGTFVFAAGTIQWAWGLSFPGVVDARVQHITQNVFRRAGLLPVKPGDTFGSETPPAASMVGAATVQLFAGSPGVEGRTDGPAATATFRRPLGAAVDAAGNIYVTDNGNHLVRRIANDAAHTVTTIAGTGVAGLDNGPGATAALSSPSGIAALDDGTLVVTDSGNNRLVRLRPNGPNWDVEHLAGSIEGRSGNAAGSGVDARFRQPSGLAAVGNDVYVADAANNRICRVTSTGDVTVVVAGGSGHLDGPGSTARMREPTGVRHDGGALWVVDSGNRALRRVALDASFTTTTVAGVPGHASGFRDGEASAALFMPHHGIVTAGTQVFVADSGNNRIRRIANGAVGTLVGENTTGAAAALSLPTDLLRLPSGDLLVVVNGDSTLRRITYSP